MKKIVCLILIGIITMSTFTGCIYHQRDRPLSPEEQAKMQIHQPNEAEDNQQNTDIEERTLDLSTFKTSEINCTTVLLKDIYKFPCGPIMDKAEQIGDNLFVQYGTFDYNLIIYKFNLNGELLNQLVVPSHTTFVYNSDKLKFLCNDYVLVTDLDFNTVEKIPIDPKPMENWEICPHFDSSGEKIFFSNSEKFPCVLDIKSGNVDILKIPELKDKLIGASYSTLNNKDKIYIYVDDKDFKKSYICVYDYVQKEVDFIKDYDVFLSSGPDKHLLDTRTGIEYRFKEFYDYNIHGPYQGYFAGNMAYIENTSFIGNIDDKTFFTFKTSLDDTGNINIVNKNLLLVSGERINDYDSYYLVKLEY